ncbi:MAG: hypothetical protein FWG98_13315 [Candidatus Cloacimonetes bacterium]|nr:hypothetical protein [Candidatus Cloacimonadota bacterium]
MFKRLIIVMILLSLFLVLNAQMMSQRQSKYRINLGLGFCGIFGEDVMHENDGLEIASPSFAVGLSIVNDLKDQFVTFEPGIRHIMRGFSKNIAEGADEVELKQNQISYIDIFGKIKFGNKNVRVFTGTGVAIAPFTEYYNTFNIPVYLGLDWYPQELPFVLGIESDILLLDMPVKDVYTDFNKVKCYTVLASFSYLF